MENQAESHSRTLFVPMSPSFLPSPELENGVSRRSGTEEHFSVMQAEPGPGTAQEEQGNGAEELCRICDGQLKTETRVRVGDCEHQFCRDCLQQYLETKISERKTDDLKCPSFGCEGHFSEEFLYVLLSPEMYEKLLRFRRRNQLEKNVNFRWCPRPECEGFDVAEECVIVSGKKRKLVCNQCSFAFCYYCGEAWHVKDKCKGEGDLKLDQWAKQHNAKFCPNCKLRVQKTRGCQHMTCFKCRYQWCWLCGDRYTPEHYYACPVKHLRKRNPPWRIVFFLLFMPALFPFLLVIATWFILEEHISRAPTHSCCDRLIRARVLSYPLFGGLALAITPLVLALFILFVFVAGLAELGRYYRYEKHCLGAIARHRCIWLLLSLLLGVSLSPLAALIVALAVAVSPLIAVYFVCMKAVILTIRCCCRPNFMKANVVPGYDLG